MYSTSALIFGGAPCTINLQAHGTGEEDDSDEVIFSCRLDNAKSIATILSCLSHGTRKDQQAQCEVW